VVRAAQVGVDGRYAPYIYYRLADDEVPVHRRKATETGTTVRKQVDAYLSMLFPGAQVNVQALAATSLFALQFRVAELGPWLRPANVGFGYAYVFPILVALVTAQDGQAVVIDSPEAHLHPFAQSQMGRILAQFAAAGVQVIVETHSDHLLNGARLAVREGEIHAEDVALHFFSGTAAAQHGVTSPVLDENGRVDNWPEGFFDQGERDLARLAGWE
jgi:predicted ATPase